MFQDHFGNGGIGLVIAFGSTEVLMLIAFIWLLPRGAVGIGALLDSLRVLVAAGVTALIISALPSFTPWLAVPATIALYIGLGLASGLIRKTELEMAANLVLKR